MKDEVINLIKVPLSYGSENINIQKGPEAFVRKGIINIFNNIGLTIKELGEICAEDSIMEDESSKVKNVNKILDCCSRLAQKVYEASNDKTLVIGGDHSIALGSVSGVAHKYNYDLGLVWIDAHADMNTPETTLTGSIHGMPLAALLGFGDKRMTELFSPQIKIKKENLIVIGAKDFDQAELDLIENERLNVISIQNILEFGWGRVYDEVRKLSSRVSNIWVSLDLDSIDSQYAPGVGMPNFGGLTYREITNLTQVIGQACKIVGIDIVEYDVDKDISNKTFELSLELLAKIFGKKYDWYTKYMEEQKK